MLRKQIDTFKMMIFKRTLFSELNNKKMFFWQNVKTLEIFSFRFLLLFSF